MPALLFDWNDAGFNDTAVPNCRNGVAGQTKTAIISNLIAHGARNFMNKNLLFIFPKGEEIANWSKNVTTNLPWYEIIIYFKFFFFWHRLNPLSFLKGQ